MEEKTNQSDVEKTKILGEVLKDSFEELRETFRAFFKAPKALWGINVSYVLEGLVYFGILTILRKYSSENVGLTDSRARLVLTKKWMMKGFKTKA